MGVLTFALAAAIVVVTSAEHTDLGNDNNPYLPGFFYGCLPRDHPFGDARFTQKCVYPQCVCGNPYALLRPVGSSSPCPRHCLPTAITVSVSSPFNAPLVQAKVSVDFTPSTNVPWRPGGRRAVVLGECTTHLRPPAQLEAVLVPDNEDGTPTKAELYSGTGHFGMRVSASLSVNPHFSGANASRPDDGAPFCVSLNVTKYGKITFQTTQGLPGACSFDPIEPFEPTDGTGLVVMDSTAVGAAAETDHAPEFGVDERVSVDAEVEVEVEAQRRSIDDGAAPEARVRGGAGGHHVVPAAASSSSSSSSSPSSSSVASMSKVTDDVFARAEAARSVVDDPTGGSQQRATPDTELAPVSTRSRALSRGEWDALVADKIARPGGDLGTAFVPIPECFNISGPLVEVPYLHCSTHWCGCQGSWMLASATECKPDSCAIFSAVQEVQTGLGLDAFIHTATVVASYVDLGSSASIVCETDRAERVPGAYNMTIASEFDFDSWGIPFRVVARFANATYSVYSRLTNPSLPCGCLEVEVSSRNASAGGGWSATSCLTTGCNEGTRETYSHPGRKWIVAAGVLLAAVAVAAVVLIISRGSNKDGNGLIDEPVPDVADEEEGYAPLEDTTL